MRTALVCPYSCTVPGGVQAQVLGMARALRAYGDEVVVLAPAGDGARAGALDEEALDGARFVRVGDAVTVPANGSRAPVSPWPATMSRTVAALERFAPEVVNVHEPFVPGPSLAAVWRGPRPVVATLHRAGPGPLYRLYGHAVGWLCRRLDEVVAVSPDAKATGEACLPGLSGRISIIPNGVEVSRLANACPWPSVGPTVVFVGRHEPRKGLEVLLDAFRGLEGGTRLWVLGSGPETARLRAAFSGDARIEWVGPVGDEERARRLAGADLFVAPSLGGESFGVVLLEAMAAGTAVLASDIAGYRLAANGAARLVSPGQPVQLRRAIAELLSDETGRADLVARGRARAAECDMARTASGYRELFAHLSAGHRG